MELRSAPALERRLPSTALSWLPRCAAQADILDNCGGGGMLDHPGQVNDGEDADPCNIKKTPEQAQPVQAGDDEWVQPAHVGLTSQENDPEQANADVKAVAADQREEGGEKTTSPWTGAGRSHAVQFRNLHDDEAESEEKRHAEPRQCARALPCCDRHAGETERRAACQ